MDYLEIAIKAFILISILNVWFIRTGKPTQWRGGEASSLKEEFTNYGLPIWFMYLIGFLKVGSAAVLFISIWKPELELYGAAGIAILMAGAIAMHIRISDPLKRSFPAFSFLILALITIWL
jgi:hypothetical protein